METRCHANLLTLLLITNNPDIVRNQLSLACVTPLKATYAAPTDLIEDPMMTTEVLKNFQRYVRGVVQVLHGGFLVLYCTCLLLPTGFAASLNFFCYADIGQLLQGKIWQTNDWISLHIWYTERQKRLGFTQIKYSGTGVRLPDKWLCYGLDATWQLSSNRISSNGRTEVTSWLRLRTADDFNQESDNSKARIVSFPTSCIEKYRRCFGGLDHLNSKQGNIPEVQSQCIFFCSPQHHTLFFFGPQQELKMIRKKKRKKKQELEMKRVPMKDPPKKIRRNQ